MKIMKMRLDEKRSPEYGLDMMRMSDVWEVQTRNDVWEVHTRN